MWTVRKGTWVRSLFLGQWMLSVQRSAQVTFLFPVLCLCRAAERSSVSVSRCWGSSVSSPWIFRGHHLKPVVIEEVVSCWCTALELRARARGSPEPCCPLRPKLTPQTLQSVVLSRVWELQCRRTQSAPVWSQPGVRRDGAVLRHAELKLSCPYFCSWKTHAVKVMGIMLSVHWCFQTPYLSHYFTSGVGEPRHASIERVAF